MWTFLLSSILPFLSPSLWETAHYRLKYCLKGPLNPNQPSAFKNNHLEFRAIQRCIQKHTQFEYRALGATFSSAFENIHIVHRAEIDVQLRIQHHTHFEYRAMGSTFSSAFENTHLEDRAVGSIVSCALKTIHTLNIELWVRHTALHWKTFILNFELWDQLCIHRYTQFEYRDMGSTYSFAFEHIRIEHRAMRSTLSSTFNTLHIFIVERCIQHSALHSKPYPL